MKRGPGGCNPASSRPTTATATAAAFCREIHPRFARSALRRGPRGAGSGSALGRPAVAGVPSEPRGRRRDGARARARRRGGGARGRERSPPPPEQDEASSLSPFPPCPRGPRLPAPCLAPSPSPPLERPRARGGFPAFGAGTNFGGGRRGAAARRGARVGGGPGLGGGGGVEEAGGGGGSRGATGRARARAPRAPPAGGSRRRRAQPWAEGAALGRPPSSAPRRGGSARRPRRRTRRRRRRCRNGARGASASALAGLSSRAPACASRLRPALAALPTVSSVRPRGGSLLGGTRLTIRGRTCGRRRWRPTAMRRSPSASSCVLARPWATHATSSTT